MSAFCADIKIFYGLLLYHSNLRNEKAQFIVPLSRYLNTRLFYSVFEFLVPKYNGWEYNDPGY